MPEVIEEREVTQVVEEPVLPTGTEEMPKDFNRIKQWLIPKLEAKNITIEEFANAAGLSRASIYFYITDKHRPDEQAMAKMCHVLGVELVEGLRQYTPRFRGRPHGSKSATTEVRARNRS